MNGINKDSPVFTNGQISDASGSSGRRFHLNIWSLSCDLNEKFMIFSYHIFYMRRIMSHDLYHMTNRIAEPHWFHKTTLDREYNRKI